MHVAPDAVLRGEIMPPKARDMETGVVGSPGMQQAGDVGSAVAVDDAASHDGRSHDGVWRARRAFRISLLVACVAVALAVFVNWFRSPGADQPLPGSASSQVILDPATFTPGTSSVELLPPRILTYETITLQVVPGQENRSAEAIYVTLSMDVEVQRPINSYARVEQFATNREAEDHVAEIMAAYELGQVQLIVGNGLIATAGFSSDESDYAVAWVRGESAYLVKTSYLDVPPVQNRREFLFARSGPVVDAVATHRSEDE